MRTLHEFCVSSKGKTPSFEDYEDYSLGTRVFLFFSSLQIIQVKVYFKLIGILNFFLGR